MKKYPKTVWVGFDGFGNPSLAYKIKPYFRSHKTKRYHLHPGNEVKLKRENAAMRKWLPMFIEACGKDKAWQEVMSEMSRKMPDLFNKGTRE